MLEGSIGEVLSFSLALFTAAVLGFFFRRWLRSRPTLPTKIPEVKITDLPLEIIFLSLSEEVSFHAETPRVEAQSHAWQTRMLACGKVFDRQGVRCVRFLHGTFAGSDPINVLPPLRLLMPQLTGRFQGKIESLMKSTIDHLAGDNGNFVPAYIECFRNGLAFSSDIGLFQWTSGNHHLARLEAALRLIDTLSVMPMKANDRTLLIGHSHARQVFALFTHLVSLSPLGLSLWQLAREEKFGLASQKEKARSIHKYKIDFVTLGGPIRYPWTALPEMRVLHLVNHRGPSPEAQFPLDFLMTKGGDYMQQWGGVGSDAIATTSQERAINRRLDTVLGIGWDARVWIDAQKSRRRVGDFGRTLLIDFKDQARWRPNCHRSLFGHGAYTRLSAQLFLCELLVEHLYQA